MSDEPSFTCPACGQTSYSPRDVAAGYCGKCKDYTYHAAGKRRRVPTDWVCANCRDEKDCLVHLTGRFAQWRGTAKASAPESDSPGPSDSSPDSPPSPAARKR